MFATTERPLNKGKANRGFQLQTQLAGFPDPEASTREPGHLPP